MIFLGTSWAEGTSRAERIQRWSSKDMKDSGMILLLWVFSVLHVRAVEHELFMP